MAVSEQAMTITSDIPETLIHPSLGALPVVKREDFYYNDGNVIFALHSEGSALLYRLYNHFLQDRGSHFRDLLTFPKEQDDPEGMLPSHPIWLPSTVSAKDFDFLLLYLFKGHSNEHVSDLDFICSLLKMGDMYDIADGRNYAIHLFTQLASKYTASPVLQIELAQRYDIEQWFLPGLRRMINHYPIEDMRPSQLDQLGPKAVYVIGQIKHEYGMLARRICNPAPVHIPGSHCFNREKCEAAWQHEWWEGIARAVFHPDHPMDLGEIEYTVRNTTKVAGMCGACLRATKENFTSKGDRIGQEKTKILERYAKVLHMRTGNRIKAELEEVIKAEEERKAAGNQG